MRKYTKVLFLSWADMCKSRFNFFLWRIRVIVSFLLTYSLWFAVFTRSTSVLFPYQKEEMLTYIMLVLLLSSFVFSTQTQHVATDIYYGGLSTMLLKPIGYFRFYLVRDIADKILNTIFSFFELALLLILFHPPMMLQTDPIRLALFFCAVLGACILFFEISLLLSLLGFWSTDTWAPRFVFFILVAFLAGTYFPLDILSDSLYQFLLFLPFPYLIFFPIRLYIGILAPTSILSGFLLLSFWILFMSFMLRVVWKRGLMTYTAAGG